MNDEKYADLIVSPDLSIVDFISIGPQGAIRKRVAFLPMRHWDVYHLAFGDVEPGTDKLNDMVVSNNGDRDKVLATVIHILYMYTCIYTDRWVYFEGGTSARTRLYRIVITSNLDELLSHLDIYGILSDRTLEPFEVGGLYEAFLVRKKE